MVLGDPALIVSLCTRGDSWSVRTDDRHLISWLNSLRSTRGSLGSLPALTSSPFLWEEGGDPGFVDKVACPCEGREEEEVEKDAVDA